MSHRYRKGSGITMSSSFDGCLPCSCTVNNTPFELLKGGFKVSSGIHVLVGT